jgi:hypothetical protein
MSNEETVRTRKTLEELRKSIGVLPNEDGHDAVDKLKEKASDGKSYGAACLDPITLANNK